MMENILVQQNQHWHKGAYDGLIARDCLPALINLFNLQEIMVLLGVRRSGKTTLFRLLMNHLTQSCDPKSILYVNLDDPFFDESAKDAKQLYKIIETATRHTGVTIDYLFLDEIQNVNAWEKYVKSVYDSNVFKKIFVTGSNSNLLHGEYATLLSGRYVHHTVYPLSFYEVCYHHEMTDRQALVINKPKVLALLDNALVYGTFPEVFLQKDKELKRKILINYYETILLKDCIYQEKLPNPRLARELAHYLITHITSQYSYNSIKSYLDSNEHTIKDYLAALTFGFLFTEIKGFSYSLKTQSRSKKKIYCVDNGLISSVAFQFSGNKGQLFENLVFCELQKIGCSNIFVFNDKKECDFLVNYYSQYLPIQVCYQITADNREREIQGAQLAMHEVKSAVCLIITFDQEERVDEKTFIIPMWKLFFECRTPEDLFLYFK
jgi:predicted AAA+ superfamily ATPase